MFQVYFYISGNKGTEEFETFALTQSRFDELLRGAIGGSYYISIIDSDGSTLQEVLA